MRARRVGTTSIAGIAALVTLFVIGTSTVTAGNRAPVRTLVATPGPSEINYGENVGYTASLTNSQSSTFTKVVYRHLVPTTTLGGASQASTLAYSSCEPTRTSWPTFAPGSWYACPELAQLRAGETAKVLLVWKAPGLPAQGDGIACGATNSCSLTSRGEWTIKEGTGKPGSAGPDTFAVDPIATPLYAASTDLTRARGYVLGACSSGSSLETSVLTPVGPSNRVYTQVCVPNVPGVTSNPLDPGLVVQIDEKLGGPLTEDVDVCVPVPGNTCGGDYEPWEFTPSATFRFTIDNTTLPLHENVDVVLHDDDGDGAFDVVTDDCTITVPNTQSITVVTCTASRNGSWRFG